jgi:two-component system, chemotaxis family, chemotaxis protein CheY
VSLAEQSNLPAGLHILVVDDSPIMRRMVIHALKVAGVVAASIEQAAHGVEVLALLEQRCPDLVLCDVHMPTMDGVELIHRLAQQGKLRRLPVVMISSDRNDAQQAELEKLGVRGFLHKPFYPEALGKVVRDVLGAKEAS